MLTPIERIRRAETTRPRIAVLGDLMLDRWLSGESTRIAREAPAPVVDVSGGVDAPGGAANTVHNAALLGAAASAIGVVGNDESGMRLSGLLENAGVDMRGALGGDDSPTTTKTRICADDQVLLRFDIAHDHRDDERVQDALCAELASQLPELDVLIICDYGKLLGDKLIAKLTDLSRPPFLIVDAHEPERWRALRPDVVTPNAAETERLLGRSLGSTLERVVEADAAASELFDITGAGCVIVTLDRLGSVVLQRDAVSLRTHAYPAPDRQASGAGDVFVAAIGVALGSGLPLQDATEFAQTSADIAVRRSGTCICSLEDHLAWAQRHEQVAPTAEELRKVLDEHRRNGARIVFTNGCFDVLHRGHTTYLKQAKQLGDILVVGLNSDDSVRRLKGDDRPVNPARDRAGVLAELSCVDYVTVFEENTASDLIRLLRPDIYTKGGDYSPEMLAEADAVHEVGGEIVLLDYVPDHSTSRLISRIRARRTAEVAS